MTLPDIIPVFPLPNVVLFPQIVLPLHIFEPRYREMVRDAARGPRLIGMALLREGWQPDYHGGPPIFTTGTVGEMVRMEELPDGRFNIVLRGLREFVVQRELRRRPYREAVVAWHAPLAGPLPPGLRKGITSLVRLYIERLGQEARDRSARRPTTRRSSTSSPITSTCRRSRSRRSSKRRPSPSEPRVCATCSSSGSRSCACRRGPPRAGRIESVAGGEAGCYGRPRCSKPRPS